MNAAGIHEYTSFFFVFFFPLALSPYSGVQPEEAVGQAISEAALR